VEIEARFLRRDPLGPISNVYVYAENNPLIWTDPTGLLFSWQSIVGVIAMGVGGTVFLVPTGPTKVVGGILLGAGFVAVLLDIVAGGGDVTRITKGQIRDTIQRARDQTGLDSETLIRTGQIPMVSDLLKMGFTYDELVEMGVVKAAPHCGMPSNR